MKKVSFTTKDHVIIVGNFFLAEHSHHAALLLHMMPSTKESWLPMQHVLAHHDISSLAIDLRGHGESTYVDGHVLDYQSFNDALHQATTHDIEAAVEFLSSNGFSTNRIFLMGASIGANLSLCYTAKHPEISRVVLLSPGLDYRGVTTELCVKKLLPTQSLLTIASQEDTYSYASSRTLFDLATCDKKMMEYEGMGHGTTMLERNPELTDHIINFFTQTTKK